MPGPCSALWGFYYQMFFVLLWGVKQEKSGHEKLIMWIDILFLEKNFLNESKNENF